VQRALENSLTVSAHEEGTVDAGRWMRNAPPTGVLAKHFCQVVTDGSQPGLEELGIPNGKQGVCQVYVRNRQVSSRE
jgi:hypothetical protein